MKRTFAILSVALLTVLVVQSRRKGLSGVEAFELDPALERVRLVSAPGTLLTVTGGDWVDGRLYLLDAGRSQVVVLEERVNGWEEVLSFGGQGGGPGELESPMDLLWLPGPEEIVVLTMAGEAHHFTRSGRFLRAEHLDLPCTFGKRSLTLRSPDDVWISGNCALEGASADTVFAVMEGRNRMGDWVVFAKQPRFTLDGRFGTPFGIQSPVAGSPAQAFLSNGNDLCFQVVPAAATDPEVGEERCFPGTLFAAPEPPDFPKAPLRYGQLFTWPDPLPAISGAGIHRDHLVLVRLYGADSVFLESHDLHRAADLDPVRLAGGPFDGFVGCRRFGCLWFQPDLGGNRIGILHFSDYLPGSGALDGR